MTKTPKLLEKPVNVRGRWMLHEPDGLVSIDCPLKGFDNEAEAIVVRRKVNRERLGLPPDSEAFKKGQFKNDD